MYVSGGVGLVIFIFALLMVFGVIPMTNQTVGALIAGLCFGFVGPIFVKAA